MTSFVLQLLGDQLCSIMQLLGDQLRLLQALVPKVQWERIMHDAEVLSGGQISLADHFRFVVLAGAAAAFRVVDPGRSGTVYTERLQQEHVPQKLGLTMRELTMQCDWDGDGIVSEGDFTEFLIAFILKSRSRKADERHLRYHEQLGHGNGMYYTPVACTTHPWHGRLVRYPEQLSRHAEMGLREMFTRRDNATYAPVEASMIEA